MVFHISNMVGLNSCSPPGRGEDEPLLVSFRVDSVGFGSLLLSFGPGETCAASAFGTHHLLFNPK